MNQATLPFTFNDWHAELQQAAHKMKQSTGMKLGHCYEKIARSKGYNTYAAYRAAMVEEFSKMEKQP